LRQKVRIAELQAAARAEAASEADRPREDGGGDDERSESESEESEDETPQEQLQRILSQVTPCASAYPLGVVQSQIPQRVEAFGGKWTDIKGLRLAVKPASDDDCVLVVANCLATPECGRDESRWAVQRGGSVASSTFAVYNRQPEWSHYICMPYVDQPGRGEQEYQVSAKNGSNKTRVSVSPQKQRRQLLALTVPAYQVSVVEDDERQTIHPGLWTDVQDFYEVVTTLPGDKVLAICTIGYAASWASEMNRGRFTLVRDQLGLDGLEDRGLQSVRALAPNKHRTMLMVSVDEPPPGPHIYRARAALTVGSSETGVANIIEGDRQLALIRLPGAAVAGPARVSGPVTVDEAHWTEIPGLSVSVTLARPREKVLIVFHVDCNPQEHFYDARFTVFRRSEAGPGAATSLGFSEDFGVDLVSSDYAASSEFPAGILCDTPGSAGTWTYSISARSENTGTSSTSPRIVVGYSGSISAIRMSSR
jgi:hypothetical protein